MRTAYRDHLDAFSRDLQRMSDTVRAIMKHASTAVLEASLDDAEAALTAADSLKEIRDRCERRSMQLLALENPVASELRQIFTSIYIVEDFNRMGALAKHIANTARLRHPDPVVPLDGPGASLRESIVEFAGRTDTMGELIHDQLISPDADLALEMNELDDAVDDTHKQLLTTLTSREWEGPNRLAVDLALIARFYERYADHCVNVAARIVFLVTGLTPENYIESKDSDGQDVEMDERFQELERYFAED